MYKIVLIGCGRSGTTFMTDVLRKNGYNVGHERLYEDGGCGWKLIEKHNVKLWDGNSENVVHIVRNPLHCIASMQTHRKMVFDVLSKNLGTYKENRKITDKIHLASKVWLDVNTFCHRKSEGKFINIEDYQKISNIIEIENFEVKARLNKRPHRDFKNRIMTSPYWPQIKKLSRVFNY